jgi:hypothetical protein
VNLFGWLTVLGAVAASVGFTVYGMGTSTLIPDPLLIDVGKYLLVGGLLALIVGYVAYRATERSRSS